MTEINWGASFPPVSNFLRCAYPLCLYRRLTAWTVTLPCFMLQYCSDWNVITNNKQLLCFFDEKIVNFSEVAPLFGKTPKDSSLSPFSKRKARNPPDDFYPPQKSRFLSNFCPFNFLHPFGAQKTVITCEKYIVLAPLSNMLGPLPFLGCSVYY